MRRRRSLIYGFTPCVATSNISFLINFEDHWFNFCHLAFPVFLRKFLYHQFGQTRSTNFWRNFLEEWPPPPDSEGPIHLVKPCFQPWKEKLVGEKGKITPKNHVSASFMDQALCVWVVLGERNFGGENQTHFGNQGWFWKLDKIIFPMSYPGLYFDIRKAVKVNLKILLRVWHWRCAFDNKPRFSLFLSNLIFTYGKLVFY